jgi:hypothetical protein
MQIIPKPKSYNRSTTLLIQMGHICPVDISAAFRDLNVPQVMYTYFSRSSPFIRLFKLDSKGLKHATDLSIMICATLS